jgi:plasmid maintenance system antidote protein VapI
MKEYRVKVTVRNNLLLSAIEDAGYKAQSEFARACGVTPQEINSLVAMRKPPINIDGTFSPMAKTVMEVLGACPTDLWTEEQLTMELRRNTVEKELSKEEHEKIYDTFKKRIDTVINLEHLESEWEDIKESPDFEKLVSEAKTLLTKFKDAGKITFLIVDRSLDTISPIL